MYEQLERQMYEKIWKILSPVCEIRTAIQLQADEGALPSAYCIFQRVTCQPRAFFSGKPRRLEERYSVTIFDRSKEQLEEKEPEILRLMTDAGFLAIAASGGDTYDTNSEHWSRILDFRYYHELT